jgi:periplasmic mercuric ion binding protein
MRNLVKHLVILTITLLTALTLIYAVEGAKTVKIKTSAQCGQCKDRIEKNLSKENGVLETTLDVKTAICTIKYDSTKITEDDIRIKLSEIGYDADSVKAVKRAYIKLPKCCKKPIDR